MRFLDKFKKPNKKEKIEKPVEEKEEEREKKKEKAPTLQKFIYGYRVIKSPYITEKATNLTSLNKYVFKVTPKANKTEIKKAIENMYDVKVIDVNIIHIPGKRRRFGRIEGWRHGLKRGFKKAIVTLKKGDKIELLPK